MTYCKSNSVDCILLSELSRLGRNVYAVLENVHYCIDNHINIFFQKEGLSLFQDNGTPNPFLTIFVSVLGTCAQIERENIQFRLNSGRQQYLAPGGKVGRKPGSVKTLEMKEQEYKSVIRELRRGTSGRRTATLCDVSISTVQRLKKNSNYRRLDLWNRLMLH